MSLGLNAGDIAQAVQGRLQGDANVPIEGAAGLAEAEEDQISFFHNLKYAATFQKTRARVIIVPENTNGTSIPDGKTLIRVANPQWAFAHVLGIIEQKNQKHPKGIHDRAFVDPTARLAPNASIGAFAVIEAGVTVGEGSIIYAGCFVGAGSKIGDGCLIYPNVVLRESTQIGNRVIIHAGAVLGADGYGFAPQDGRHHKIPQIGRVVIDDDVEIGANVTIDRATTGETRVGAGTKIDNLVHIAHNVQIGRDCLIIAQVGISGSTRIGNRVTLAGQAGIVGHITIGDGATIGAQSGILSNVAPGEVLFGTPARPFRKSMKLEGIISKLPEIYDVVKQLRKKFLS